MIEDDLATSSIAQEENRPMRTIGLTVRPKEDAVQVHLSWAEYTLEDDEWIREPHELDHNISLQNVSEAGGEGVLLDHPHHGIRVLAKCSERHDGARLLTVRLINDRRAESVSERQHNALHQARIELKGSFADVRGFVGRRESDMNLLYHDSKVFAFGHNIAVDWISSEHVHTRWLAKHEVPAMVAAGRFTAFGSTFDVLTSKNGSKNCLLLAGSLFVSMKRGERGRLILFLVQK